MIGITIGLVAGFSRGWLDRFISFVIDTFLSLPFLLMALALAPIIILRFNDQPKILEVGTGHLADLHPDPVRLDDPRPTDPRRGALAA